MTISVSEAFERVVVSRELTEEEARFVYRVLTRLKTIVEETQRQAKELFGFEPETSGDNLTAVFIISAIDPNPRPPTEDLLVGINNYPNPEIILIALRDIAKASFPSDVLEDMLEIFS